MSQQAIRPGMSSGEVLKSLRQTPGYFLTNNERDVSQSDFKCRILPHTTLRAAPYRDETGYFAFEISGGASVHMDLMYKHISPLEKLRLVRQAMPQTQLQIACRGRYLFGYRPYPPKVIRNTVRVFSRYVDVWKIYDFMNHVPNLEVLGQEVLNQDKVLMPSLCFSIGEQHTDEFYVGKVAEILQTFGPNIILSLENHSGVGTPERIGELVQAIRAAYPDLLLAYHGHNTDGADLCRMVAAVKAGVKIAEIADHGFGGVFSPAPGLSLVQTLNDSGLQAPGLKIQPLLDASDILRTEKRYYEQFETQFRGHDPTVKRHKLTGGAASLIFEQAEHLGLLDRIHQVLEELAQVNQELGDIWSTTPGSQILWSTAVSNVLYGRYEQPSDDLERLLLGRYGPFPFYNPPDWIMQKVLEKKRKSGRDWQRILAEEGGVGEDPEVDLEGKKDELEQRLGRSAEAEELALYLLFPGDLVDYVRFRERFGKTWLLPPHVWFKKGGFADGTRISILDDFGKTHQLDIISTRQEEGRVKTSMLVDHHFQIYTHTPS